MAATLDMTWGQGLDPAQVAGVLRRFGRAHLPGVLPDATARALHRSLIAEVPFRRHLAAGDRHVTMPMDAFEAQPEAWKAEVYGAVRTAAAAGFSYLFDNYALAEEIEGGTRLGLAVEQVYDALNSPAGLKWLRLITGEPRCAYVDAQATRFLAGHFLTQHDDDVSGKDRLFAYVLNLTPEWRADWGGLLLFTDGDGHVSEGYTPAFNALNLLRVPQEHLVTEVASYAPGARLSITGWIRSRRPAKGAA